MTDPKKGKIFKYTISFAFILISVNLFRLQILQGDFWQEKSSRTSIQLRLIEPSRGDIFDSKGVLLAKNRPGYSIMVDPQTIKKYPGVAPTLAYYLGVDNSYIFERVDTNSTILRRIARDVSLDLICKLEEHRDELPGVQIIAEPVREYPLGKYTAHVIGYVGEISPQELKMFDSSFYAQGDLIGKIGIERQYDSYLKGRRGHEFVEVDKLGRILQPFSEKEPVLPSRGCDVYTTIDTRLQQKVYYYLWYNACTGIVMNVKTGAILAMVSKPSFPPDSLSFGLRQELWDSIISNPLHPFLNRAIASNFPPASTLKPLTALVALETGVLDTGPPLEPCEGNIDLKDGLPHKCSGGPHGKLTLSEALMFSCDIFFYQTGLRIGYMQFIRWLRMFGFGQRTGIDLFPESQGLLPDSVWMDSRYGVGKWPKGVIVNLCIGQGELLATPVQILRYFSSIANGGYLVKPFVVDSVKDERGQIVYRAQVVKEKLDLIPEDLEIVKRALISGVNDERGTGYECRIRGLTVAGKTGTAEHRGEHDHSYFVGFAPAEDPEIAVIVIIESAGGTGGRIAAPISRLIFEYYFTKISPHPALVGNIVPVVEDAVFMPVYTYEDDTGYQHEQDSVAYESLPLIIPIEDTSDMQDFLHFEFNLDPDIDSEF
ncbi:penicillin-binding protein 2 [candidate division WOR-3 bacterium]|nr:penicillin-binding protein 2 [candidate division WOR-3 bacterium]